ncbi:MAG TPA: TerC family protein [Longimicrobiales bacterium]|nr:TerC family protein [Longimicrobiales bacterium]
MDWITEPSAWIAFATLTLLEIVLGIDNVVFISILADKLPKEQREKARIIGLGLAMIMRILLLFLITWIIRLTQPLFEVLGQEISGRDLILIIGGLFLLFKSTHEIHDNLEGEHGQKSAKVAATLGSVLIQIMLLDIVFSLDSVITAVGMVDEIAIMITAVVVSIGFMLLFSSHIARFVEKHPTIKMLALAFLILIGVTLIAEGLGQHISKGYIYFAMAFSVGVEFLNLKMRAKAAQPVHLHSRYGDRPSEI